MARPLLLLLAIGIAALPVPLAAQTQTLPPQERLSEDDLAKLRGGFDLPGGVSVTIGVTTGTSVDGREVLRTVFDLGNGAPRLSVLANGGGQNGVAPVTLTADGAAVATADGTVRLHSGAGGPRVELSGAGLDVSHLVGQALGSIVENSANNRTVDVATTVNIGLGGIKPDAVGGSMAQVGNLALDATTRMIR